MKVIGITGGVGTGKTTVLTYISQKYNAEIIYADRLAESLIKRGEVCYEPLVHILGSMVLNQDGEIDRAKMAAKIFEDGELLIAVNQIIHPAVKQHILNDIVKLRRSGKRDFLFIEAALLIEDGYKNIVDELWYIYSDEASRRERLKASRCYTDDKIDGIMKNQLSEEIFREQCDVVIDNSKESEYSEKQIDQILGEQL